MSSPQRLAASVLVVFDVVEVVVVEQVDRLVRTREDFENSRASRRQGDSTLMIVGRELVGVSSRNGTGGSDKVYSYSTIPSILTIQQGLHLVYYQTQSLVSIVL